MNNKSYKLKKTKAKKNKKKGGVPKTRTERERIQMDKYIPSLKAYAASAKISRKERAALIPEHFTLADEEIIPARKIQHAFRTRMPTRQINRRPELMTESTMRKQIHYHFKNDYEKFVNLLYNRLEKEHDYLYPWPASGEHHDAHSLNMILNNTDHNLLFILNQIIIKPYEPNERTRRKRNILDYHPTISNAPLTCDITCCGGYLRFIGLMRQALLLYPYARNQDGNLVLTILNQKPNELTNEQFALKNILSFIKGIILKYMYEEFLDNKYGNSGANVAKANEDPRYEGVSIFEKSSRSSRKNSAKKKIKKNKTMKTYIKKIRGKQD